MEKRRTPVCIACRKAHGAEGCGKPKRARYQVSEDTRSQREFMAACLAVQDDLRRKRNA